MVKRRVYILFFLFILAGFFSCKMSWYYNMNCDKNCNDIVINENIFSVIDTTQIYNINYIETGYNSVFCKFSSSGTIQYLFLDNNGKYKNIPKKYRRGNYYVQKGRLVLNVYIKFPQGGGKTKEIFQEEYNGILYFRNNNECEKSIRLTPITAKYNQQ